MDDSPRKLNSKRWRTELCKKLMQVSWDMWDFRNSVRHSSSSVHYQQELERLREEVREELTKGTAGLLSADFYRVLVDPNQWLHQSLGTTEHWLLSIQAARARYRANKEQRARSLTQSRELMRTWLQGTGDN